VVQNPLKIDEKNSRKIFLVFLSRVKTRVVRPQKLFQIFEIYSRPGTTPPKKIIKKHHIYQVFKAGLSGIKRIKFLPSFDQNIVRVIFVVKAVE